MEAKQAKQFNFFLIFTGIVFLTLFPFGKAEAATPTISSFTPAGGPGGTTFQANGANFDSTAVMVLRSTTSAAQYTLFPYNSGTYNTPIFNMGTVPVQPAPLKGNYAVVIRNQNGDEAVASAVFKITMTVSSFTPANGPGGATIQAYGTNFDKNAVMVLKSTTSAAQYTLSPYKSGANNTAKYNFGTVPARPAPLKESYAVVIRNPNGDEAEAPMIFEVTQ
ncbi:MAG: hypothetical protein HY202_06970 [Nitrospirae bacterium]|nr:hypothetical protein [Nitrospirota bacterium]